MAKITVSFEFNVEELNKINELVKLFDKMNSTAATVDTVAEEVKTSTAVASRKPQRGDVKRIFNDFLNLRIAQKRLEFSTKDFIIFALARKDFNQQSLNIVPSTYITHSDVITYVQTQHGKYRIVI